jgi:hypothetical protein
MTQKWSPWSAAAGEAAACAAALVASARTQRGTTRQQLRAAARRFVRRHRRDRCYLRWVASQVGASSALAVALLGLSPAPAQAEIAPFEPGFFNNTSDIGQNSAPALGDLDGDGDLDVIAGEVYGAFVYFANNGSALSPSFSLSAGPLAGQDVGSFSTPALGDLDGDGDLDLVSGERFGAFVYYENTGSSTSPVFVLRSGSANPLDGRSAVSYSTPTLGDLDGDGDLDLVSGGNDLFYYFENTGSATSPAFAARTGAANPLLGLVVGGGVPALGDLDGDADPDLVAGEFDGVFTRFTNLSGRFVARTGASNPLDARTQASYPRPRSRISMATAISISCRVRPPASSSTTRTRAARPARSSSHAPAPRTPSPARTSAPARARHSEISTAMAISTCSLETPSDSSSTTRTAAARRAPPSSRAPARATRSAAWTSGSTRARLSETSTAMPTSTSSRAATSAPSRTWRTPAASRARRSSCASAHPTR